MPVTDLLRGQVDELLAGLDRELARCAEGRDDADAVLLADDPEPLDSDVVRAFDDAARRGHVPPEVGALRERIHTMDLTWDDVLDTRRPPVDDDVARARAAIVAVGFDRLARDASTVVETASPTTSEEGRWPHSRS